MKINSKSLIKFVLALVTLKQIHAIEIDNNEILDDYEYEIDDTGDDDVIVVNKKFDYSNDLFKKVQENISEYCNDDGILCSNSTSDVLDVLEIDLKYKNINSEISKSIKYFKNLEYLNISRNNITGLLPDSIKYLKKIKTIYLNDNKISGPIPKDICELENLEVLYLDNNSISGTIPEEIGNLKNLRKLYIYSNEIEGSIPESITSLENLENLYLSENKITGNIPSSIGNLKQTTILTLSNNNITGSIPNSIGEMERLKILDLSNNSLSGILPSSINDIEGLEELQLYDNIDLYGYVASNPSIVNCDYSNTNICYLKGTQACRDGAKECTEEQIKQIEKKINKNKNKCHPKNY